MEPAPLFPQNFTVLYNSFQGHNTLWDNVACSFCKASFLGSWEDSKIPTLSCFKILFEL